MKTAADLVNIISESIWYRYLAEKTIENCVDILEFTGAYYGECEDTYTLIENEQKERRRIYQIRQAMETIALIMIERGFY